jgi:DNA-binding MarR family transcriptional regulator
MVVKRGGKPIQRAQDQAGALGVLFDETVSTYLRLSAVATAMYRRGNLSGPRRTVLMALARSGPQTVAHLARGRAQSRQRLQPLVHALVSEGLLATHANPLHRQSPLVELTPKGLKLAQRVAAWEASLRAQLRLESSPGQLGRAAAVLRDVRQALEVQMEALLSADRAVISSRPRSSSRP